MGQEPSPWLALLALSSAPLCLGKGVLLPDSSLASVYNAGSEPPPAETALAGSGVGSRRRRSQRSTKGSFLSSFLDGTTEAKSAEEELRKDAAAARREEPAISATHPPRKRAAHGGHSSSSSSSSSSSTPEAGESTAFFFGSGAQRVGTDDSTSQRAPSDAPSRPSAHDRHAHGPTEMPEGFGGTRPLPAGGTRPAAPGGVSDMFGAFTTMAREIANFIVTLVDMSCTMFVTLLKKAVMGASPVAAAEKTGMGMIEYLQPYGWDPYGPGTSEDAYQQQRPETATCHYLQQTWQRQCAARPETVGLMEASLLQLSEEGGGAAPPARGPRRRLLAGKSDAPPVEGEAAGEAAGGKDAQVLYESSLKALPSSLRGWLDQLSSITPEQQRAWSAGAGSAGRPQAPSDASAPSAASAALAAAMPAAAAVASAAAAPGTSGFKLMGTMNAGMMGLGASLYNGPDLYDPQGPNGAEPVPQTTGPEKCYRLLNSWIYKCAVSPM